MLLTCTSCLFNEINYKIQFDLIISATTDFYAFYSWMQLLYPAVGHLFACRLHYLRVQTHAYTHTNRFMLIIKWVLKPRKY